jgi:PAS domain S-box-containing protein
MERFLATGEGRILNRRIEMPALHRDGHRFPAELTVTPVRMDGTYVFSAFLHDISERKRTEEALRRSEERFRLVARATNDVIWDWDVATGERTWNEAAPEVPRYSAREITPTLEWWYERIHPGDRERVVTRLHEVASGTGECWSDEYRFLRGDSSFATVLDRGYVVRDERGAPIRMIGSIMDVTERKRAEEAQRFLARASALLDVSLDAATTLTSLARLPVPSLADCCLIDIVEDGGELRRVATAHIDPRKRKLLLSEGSAEADSGPIWKLVRKVVRRGEPILLSEYSEPAVEATDRESSRGGGVRKLGFRSLMIVPIIAHGEVLGAITLATTGSGRHYSPVDLMVAEDISTAWIDSHQILRVFSNLIGNAIKFTPEGGAITVHTERLEREVLFSISDTGPGIPEEQLPHVFDRYWQARKGDRRGAGLGLAIAGGIVEAHGGRIWVESRLGQGSTFFFTVPLSQSGTAD